MASQLKQRVEKLQIGRSKPRDIDPEDDANLSDSNESNEDSQSDAENKSQERGRDHYEAVGNSKLRKTARVQLDQKKYGGKAVSRAALNGDNNSDEDDPLAAVDDDEDDDPFGAASTGRKVDSSEEDDDDDEEDIDAISDVEGGEDKIGSDDEIDSDEAFESGDEDTFRQKGFVFRGSGKDITITTMNGTREEQDDSEASILEDEDLDSEDSAEDGASSEGSDIDMDDLDEEADQDESSQDEDEDEDELAARPRPKSLKATSNTDREQLKSLIATDTASIAASLSQAASSDAKKGTAVRRQYQTFDRLLDARIKLQKALVDTNQLSLQPQSSARIGDAALERAEAAALRLYTTIESLRHTISDSTPSLSSQSKKRKRPSPATSSTPSSELWFRIITLEQQSMPIRRSTLDKWSTKTRTGTTIPSQSASKLRSDNTESKLTAVLDTYLVSESTKLITQSTTAPAPSSSSSSPSTTTPISYDDTPFYQSLLRDLIASRSALTTSSSSTVPPTLSSAPLPSTLKLHTSGNTRQKDTKASKGRKVRYTVHEKLENFMTAEGRAGGVTGQWTEAAVREFFGSLMGGTRALDEDGDVDDDWADNGGVGTGEEGALRLFRSA